MTKYLYCVTATQLRVIMDGRSCVFEDFTLLKAIPFVFVKESGLVLSAFVEYFRNQSDLMHYGCFDRDH